MSIKLIDENKIMAKLSHTEPLFGEDGTKERYRYMQWLADTNAIKELKPERAIPIPEGATNGNMIKTIFPSIDASVSGDGDVVDVYNLGIYCQTFDTEWWNAPYRVESEVEE